MLTHLRSTIDNNLSCVFVSIAGCGAVINLATYKDHASECKAKLNKVPVLNIVFIRLFSPHISDAEIERALYSHSRVFVS